MKMIKIILTVFILSMALVFVPNMAWAFPQLQEVKVGDVAFDYTSPYKLTITASNGAIIDFYNFNIAEMETVEFVQPSDSSMVTNYITGSVPTSILGTIICNGQITFNFGTSDINIGSNASGFFSSGSNVIIENGGTITNGGTIIINGSVVPEPTTGVLFCLGAVGMAAFRKRKKA